MNRALLSIVLAVLIAHACYAGESAPPLPAGVEAAPFEIQGDRLFVASTVNGDTPCLCLIDTGSEATILNRARVNAPDIHPGAIEAVQGSFVGMMQVSPAYLKKLTLGAHTLVRPPIFCASQGKGKKLELIDMVLGMDLLGQTRFTVDLKNSRILFWPPGSALQRADAGIERVQLAVHRGLGEDGTRPRVEVKLNGKTNALFLIDFGADTPLFIAPKDFRELGFAPAAEPSGAIAVSSEQSYTLNYYTQAWPKLELGSMAFEKVEGRIVAADYVGAVLKQQLQMLYNLLGTPFLKNFDAIHIDMPAKLVYFDRVKK